MRLIAIQKSSRFSKQNQRRMHDWQGLALQLLA